MKKIGTILRFELGNYFGSKSYLISTILLALLCVGIMFAPRIKESFTSGSPSSDKETDAEDESDQENESVYAYYDASGIMDEGLLAQVYPDVKLQKCKDAAEVESLVKSEDAELGYVVYSTSEYTYYVYNKGMFDDYTSTFDSYLSMLSKKQYSEAHDLDFDELMSLDYADIQAKEVILGKDSTSNYWYCYILVIVIFMLIVMYGMSIATGVANEKSNRSIEILVTTTNSRDILFGKVFAGTVAMFFQVGLIMAALLISYNFNKDYWGGFMGSVLNIPSDVLIAFAVFGLGGFLFYAFMYGALGALVSKIEDLNKSAGTAQMIVMIVYFVVLMNLTNVDGLVIRICSYLPISSYSAMFARVAMGDVATWEVVISAIILYISVIGMGVLGGKIFRNSTLRYGNPIRLSRALKELKREK